MPRVRTRECCPRALGLWIAPRVSARGVVRVMAGDYHPHNPARARVMRAFPDHDRLGDLKSTSLCIWMPKGGPLNVEARPRPRGWLRWLHAAR
jgi:hypothetical protein